jgi:hypothetical protein
MAGRCINRLWLVSMAAIPGCSVGFDIATLTAVLITTVKLGTDPEAFYSAVKVRRGTAGACWQHGSSVAAQPPWPQLGLPLPGLAAVFACRARSRCCFESAWAAACEAAQWG